MNARAKRNRGTKRKQGNARSGQSGSRWGWLNAGIVIALVGVLGVVLAAVIPHYLGPGAPSAPDLEVDSVTLQSFAEQHPSLISDA
jgi:cytochrome c-type biogenesis protein CcmH/NrfG